MFNFISRYPYKNYVLYIFAFIITFFVTTKTIIPNAGFSIIAIVWLFYNYPILFNKQLKINKKFIAILLFFIYISCSYFLNIGKLHVDDTYIHFPFVLLFYFILLNLVNDYNSLTKILLIHIIVVIPIVLLMAYRSYFYWQQPWLSPDWETGTRFGKNTVGMFLAFCFTYLYGYLQKNKSLLPIIGLLIIGACALYTISRGTLVSMSIIVTLYIIISKRKILYLGFLSFIFSSFLILNFSFGFNYMDTFFAIKNITLQQYGGYENFQQTKFVHIFSNNTPGSRYGLTQRASHYVTTAYGLLDRPIFGHGIESFRRNNGTLAHNDYLTIIYEYGLIGFFFFIYILYLHLRDLFRVRKKLSEQHKWLVEAQIVQMFVLFFTFMIMTSYASPITWYILALSAVIVDIGERESMNNKISIIQ